MQVRFAQEELTPALWDEAYPLLVEHWREVAHYQDIELDPDQSVYAAAQEGGMLRVFTVRTANGVLLGYALFLVRHNPHYRSSLQAVQDVVYLDPDARGWTGFKFLAFCDHELRREGVQAVYHHVKDAKNFGPVLERLGYEVVDHIYARRLDLNGRDGDDRGGRGHDSLLGDRREPAAPEGEGEAGRGPTEG